MSMLKDNIYLFKRFNFSVHKAAKLWNDAQLMIATITRFSWYFAANTTVFNVVV